MSLFSSGGFHLTNWTSNSQTFLRSVPDSEKAKEVKDLDLAKDTEPVALTTGSVSVSRCFVVHGVRLF